MSSRSGARRRGRRARRASKRVIASTISATRPGGHGFDRARTAGRAPCVAARRASASGSQTPVTPTSFQAIAQSPMRGGERAREGAGAACAMRNGGAAVGCAFGARAASVVEELAPGRRSATGRRARAPTATEQSRRCSVSRLLRRRSLSCGIVVLLGVPPAAALPRHRPTPLGPAEGRHPSPARRACEAALRETHEETGLVLAGDTLLDLGRHAYTAKKDLHLFACLSARIEPRELHCASTFVDRVSGRSRPEMDGFGWFAFDRIDRAVHAQARGAC